MKVTLHTLEGTVTLDNITLIKQFPSGNIALATDDEIEYSTGLDFPTTYSMEVDLDGKTNI